ncbi:hypothetical protein [Myceligenerans crystallogenes]|uniref:Tetratricopeptide repeat-containing protein n=1 Tax=Myceligenerans crystallogenes TaxID=316335 RepID=A0ABN2NQT5_9MICO
MSDLRLLEPIAQDEPAPRYGRLAILIGALVVLVGLVVWAWLFLVQDSRGDARTEAALGQSAHAAGDCAAAVPRLKSARNLGALEFLAPPVDSAELTAEIEACDELERARHAVATGNYRGAIERFDAYLASGGARYVAAVEEQSGARLSYGQELEEQGHGERAVSQYATVLADAPDSEPAERAERRVWVLFENDVEADRADEPCSVIRPARAWSRLDGPALRPVRDASHHALSWALVRCGEDRLAEGEAAARDARYDAAVFHAARRALLAAVQEYPGTKPGDLAVSHLERFSATRSAAQVTATNVAQERLRIARIKKQVRGALAGGGTLTRPVRYAGAGEEVALTIRNATGKQLYVAWTGRETDSVTVPAGSRKCGRAPSVTLTIPAGDVSVAVHDGGWAAGSWSFPSDAHRTCVK